MTLVDEEDELEEDLDEDDLGKNVQSSSENQSKTTTADEKPEKSGLWKEVDILKGDKKALGRSWSKSGSTRRAQTLRCCTWKTEFKGWKRVSKRCFRFGDGYAESESVGSVAPA
ncbi:hypothetical protein Bca52824_083689 [Brassica carinata]|uniref:Uncharacterized protein n=1 Tax=Brassica carinata TaxID=52824 RepID=A0A8X7PMQ9_BRACI|nr:hypothetical protein Bca52824_083689 [Brassica carinata]